MPHAHTRTASVESDFGSFVSVPSAEDPLHHPLSATDGDGVGSFGSLQSFGFFDRFGEEARAATAKNKAGVLDELLQHQDDPLYFLQDVDGACSFCLSFVCRSACI